MKRRPCRRAFSLIEVVLALGMVTFGLVSVVGLLPVALNVGKQADDDTAMAAMIECVSSTLRARSFQTNSAAYFAFDKDGRMLTNGSSAIVPAGAFFSCAATQAPPGSGASTNASSYRIQFVWPCGAPAASVLTNLLSVAVANYD